MCCFELLGNFRENVSDLFQANAGHAFKVNPTFSISSVEAGRMSQLPHAGPGGVATTPSAAIFSGCGW